MFDKNEFIMVIIVSFILVGFIVYQYKHNYTLHAVVYDCRLSEISPDFPTEVKKQCRELRGRI
jgi:hypothetical protein